METSMHPRAGNNHYLRLGLMAVLSFFAMYWLMYSMVNVRENAVNNLNQLYMAALMSWAMVIIELAVMSKMYPKGAWNAVIITASVLMLILSWIFIREQALISDRQFLKSMIPHHSGAILMCQQASINDPEVKDLCKNITESQQAEIDQMRVILKRLDSRIKQ